MTAAPAPSPRPRRRGSARGVRFGDPRRADVQLARKREVAALELRRQGFSVPEIAVRLGVSRQGAWEIFDRIRRRHPPSAAIAVEEATLDVCRLDRLLIATMPRAVAGSLSAIRSVVSIVEQRRGLVKALRAAMRAEAGEVAS